MSPDTLSTKLKLELDFASNLFYRLEYYFAYNTIHLAMKMSRSLNPNSYWQIGRCSFNMLDLNSYRKRICFLTLIKFKYSSSAFFHPFLDISFSMFFQFCCAIRNRVAIYFFLDTIFLAPLWSTSTFACYLGIQSTTTLMVNFSRF